MKPYHYYLAAVAFAFVAPPIVSTVASELTVEGWRYVAVGMPLVLGCTVVFATLLWLSIRSRLK